MHDKKRLHLASRSLFIYLYYSLLKISITAIEISSLLKSELQRIRNYAFGELCMFLTSLTSSFLT